MRTVLLTALILLSPMLCAGTAQAQALGPAAYANRISMDLRGTRATPGEIDTLSSGTDPDAALSALIDQYLHSPEFAERLLWLANDIFLTRMSEITVFTMSFNSMSDDVRADVVKAIGEETPRLLQHIVVNDRPLTELVTADYTIANSTLAWFWNIQYDGAAGSDEWRIGRYLDDRPHAGFITQNSFYYRYPSTFTNKNRHRANQLTRILLDDDHFLRNIAIDLRLGSGSQELDLDDAPRTSPSCIACHATMDGIAAHFYGFSLGPKDQHGYSRQSFRRYSEFGADRTHVHLGRIPEYYGFPSHGLKDLGRYIADDPRFARAMVRHIYRFYVHDRLDYRDQERITELTEIFMNSNYSARELIRTIIRSDTYRTVLGGSSEKVAAPQPELREAATRVAVWEDARRQLRDATLSRTQSDALDRILHFHEDRTADSLRHTVNSTPVYAKPGETASRGIHPFKLATPEQLHSLGRQLTGQVWAGDQGGGALFRDLHSLEFNTNFKVAAGGFDGELIVERSEAIPASYFLVLARWATVLADNAVDAELAGNRPLPDRLVFDRIQGDELPDGEDAAARDQIAAWFLRFYGETVPMDDPVIDRVMEVWQTDYAESAQTQPPDLSIQTAWRHVLALLLADIRIAVY